MMVRDKFLAVSAGLCLTACGGQNGAEAPTESQAVKTEHEAATKAETVSLAHEAAAPPQATLVSTASSDPVDYASLVGDADKGKRVYGRCIGCHAVQEGQNRSGPTLYKIIGREAGAVEGYRYSPAFQEADIVWTEEVLFEYLFRPRDFITGTRMIFPGIPSAQERADLIAYLRTIE